MKITTDMKIDKKLFNNILSTKIFQNIFYIIKKGFFNSQLD